MGSLRAEQEPKPLAPFHGLGEEVSVLRLNEGFLNILSSGYSCFSRAPVSRPDPGPRRELPQLPETPRRTAGKRKRRGRRSATAIPAAPEPLPGTLWASTFSQWFFRFLSRTVPASSPPPPGFEELSRDLGLFLDRRSHQGMLADFSPPGFSADSEEYTCRSPPWIGGPCSPGGDTADYPGCAPRWLLRGGAGPGPADS